ncbi:hypothetical protein VP01_5755g1 [Puccinia sorghi]|uniref:Uncharacterized protein n=1 Tax=Puccinia sorghi TaxID=27349 RepID=A0A0L6UIE0_9BASI|nr:hypothetical protein VP01_5755g1 [Puccinia sorghi]
MDNCFDPRQINFDSWNVTVAPDDLIGNYCVKVTIVQLTTHAPSLTDLLDFNNWAYFGKAGFYIQMEPHLIIADHLRSLIHGSQSIMASPLVEVLKKTGIKKIQLNAFGQKCGLDYICHNFGHKSKDNRIHNWFNSSLNVVAEDIVLF